MVIRREVYLRTLKGIMELVEKGLPLLTPRRVALYCAQGAIRSTGVVCMGGREPPK